MVRPEWNIAIKAGRTDEPDAALKHLGSPLRDELEPLDGVTGHWTSDPAGVVLLVRRE